MNCPTCQQDEATKLHLMEGTLSWCSVCGTLYGASTWTPDWSRKIEKAREAAPPPTGSPFGGITIIDLETA